MWVTKLVAAGFIFGKKIACTYFIGDWVGTGVDQGFVRAIRNSWPCSELNPAIQFVMLNDFEAWLEIQGPQMKEIEWA